MQGMSGASATTPSNNWLLREFKGIGSKKHALKSGAKTQRSPVYKGESSRLKLARIHEVSSFK